MKKYIIISDKYSTNNIIKAYNVPFQECICINKNNYQEIYRYYKSNLIILEEQLNGVYKIDNTFILTYEIANKIFLSFEQEHIQNEEIKQMEINELYRLKLLRLNFIKPHLLEENDVVLYRDRENGNKKGIVKNSNGKLSINGLSLKNFESGIMLGNIRKIEDISNEKYYHLSDSEAFQLYESENTNLRGTSMHKAMNLIING